MPASPSYPSLPQGITRPVLLDAQGHVCGFFHGEDEEYEVLIPFILEGLQLGERAFHIIEPARRSDHMRRLLEAGVDVARAEAAGQLVVLDWHQTYWSGGPFNRDRTMAQFAQARKEGRSQGFSRTRFICEMEWALEEGTFDEAAWYEATADLVPLDGDVAICTYQIRKWGGQLLVNALRTHALVILGGMLHENPYYVPGLATMPSPRGMPACC